ncbi:MAG: helix-turn-helix transcriptional regulator [Alphaproteobacteria bacterium]|nr:helix-turn-helix transcriptional regulator [Alphaproteobacteria bacterium]
MSYAIEEIAEALRSAREASGLSQRDLSARSGVPQSHISKIENGAVDLRLSSLVELARILDMEFMLVPRKSLSAVQAIVRSASSEVNEAEAQRRADRELTSLKNIVSNLPEQAIPKNEFEQYVRVLRELEHFRLSKSDINTIRNATSVIKNLKAAPESWNAIRQSFKELQKLRNFIAHGRGDNEGEAIRPAYSLDEDNHG